MARRRLGVVLLLGWPVADEVRGLRRALGSPSLDTQPPHITLVPPVNVPEARVDEALAVLRRAASSVPGPLTLTIGPVATFRPVSPVVYLSVQGDVDGLVRLQQNVFVGPLLRTVDYDYVGHVTLHESADGALIDASLTALEQFSVGVEIDRVHLLEQDPQDRAWRPLADVALGPPVVRGRGGVELVLRWTHLAAPDVQALWSSHGPADTPATSAWLEARDCFDALLGVRCGEFVVVVDDHLGEGIEDRLLAEPDPAPDRVAGGFLGFL
jgi:2'-5' RNA ligase